MWFLWLNWRKSTFYPVIAPKDSKCWSIVTSSILEPTASNCDVTMTDCSGVFAMGAFLAQLMPLMNCARVWYWTDQESGNLISREHVYIYKHGPAATDSYCDVTMAHCSHGYLWTHDIEVGASWRDCDNPELFGTWLHHFAYRDRMIHYGTLGDQTIYTRFGLICLFTLLIIFGLPCFNTGHR